MDNTVSNHIDGDACDVTRLSPTRTRSPLDNGNNCELVDAETNTTDTTPCSTMTKELNVEETTIASFATESLTTERSCESLTINRSPVPVLALNVINEDQGEENVLLGVPKKTSRKFMEQAAVDMKIQRNALITSLYPSQSDVVTINHSKIHVDSLSMRSMYQPRSYNTDNRSTPTTTKQLSPINRLKRDSDSCRQSNSVQTDSDNEKYRQILVQVKQNAQILDNVMETAATPTVISDWNIAASALLNLTPSDLSHNPSASRRMSYSTCSDAHTREPSQSVQSNHKSNTPSSRATNPSATADENDGDFVHPVMFTKKRLERRAHELLNDVQYTMIGCNCTKSRCLKLYCSCFQSGTLCDQLICTCFGCENTAENSVPCASRSRAIYNVLNRRIDAFDRQRKRKSSGCSCKKTKCLLKYCDCYSNGVVCCDQCSCENCSNRTGLLDQCRYVGS